MALINKYVEAAESNGWNVEIDGNNVTVSKQNTQDGYPFQLTSTIEGNTLKDGIIYNDYGNGVEEFKAGVRYHLAVIKNVNTVLRYKTFYDAFLLTQPAIRSEKEIAIRTGYSERQIRKARMCGFADYDLIDTLCVKMLAVHPAAVYGYTDWVSGVEYSDSELDKALEGMVV